MIKDKRDFNDWISLCASCNNIYDICSKKLIYLEYLLWQKKVLQTSVV